MRSTDDAEAKSGSRVLAQGGRAVQAQSSHRQLRLLGDQLRDGGPVQCEVEAAGLPVNGSE